MVEKLIIGGIFSTIPILWIVFILTSIIWWLFMHRVPRILIRLMFIFPILLVGTLAFHYSYLLLSSFIHSATNTGMLISLFLCS